MAEKLHGVFRVLPCAFRMCWNAFRSTGHTVLDHTGYRISDYAASGYRIISEMVVK